MKQSQTKANRAVWKERVQAWRSSGLPAAQFAKGKEFTYSALLYWAKRIPPEAARGFVRVIPTGSVAPRAETRSSLVLEVEGVSIRISRDFDRTLLADVVRALTGGTQ
jgi:transposase